MVKLPKNPTTIPNRTGSETAQLLSASPIIIPIKNPPTKFTSNVPKGIEGINELKTRELAKRSNVPAIDPKHIHTNVIIIPSHYNNFIDDYITDQSLQDSILNTTHLHKKPGRKP